MTTKTKCICGNTIKRTFSRRTKKARSGRGSGQIRELFRTKYHLCSFCMTEFIGSRPNHDDPNEHGTHRLCDFCNGKQERGIFLRLISPTITRWQGKVSKRKGKPQDVCTACRKSLKEFIKNKIEENSDK